MKFLVVGLGNIGNEYAYTRHNIGFLILDRMANKHKVNFTTSRLGDTAQLRLKNKVVTLLKPSTYMNLSGKAYKYWLNELSIPTEQSLCVVDEIALDFGRLRLKTRGSAGGHNGLSNIEQELKSAEYARLRFGIGNAFDKGRQVEYVLGRWTDDEVSNLPEAMDRAILCIEDAILSGFSHAMNVYNTK